MGGEAPRAAQLVAETEGVGHRVRKAAVLGDHFRQGGGGHGRPPGQESGESKDAATFLHGLAARTSLFLEHK